MNVIRKKINYKHIIINIFIFAVLYYIGLIANNEVSIRSLYMDDLNDYSYFLRQNVLDFSFNVVEGQTHYRPVAYFSIYIIFELISKNISRILFINVFINSIIGTFIFNFTDKLTNNKFLSILSGFLYTYSHFSYYQIGQAIGIMESEGTLFSLLLLYYLINNIKENKIYIDKKIYILFLLAAFTHERYIGMGIVIFIAILLKNNMSKSNKLKYILIDVFMMFLISIIRYLMTGIAIPNGTGGVPIGETFKIHEAIMFAFMQVLYIFGFNFGPEHLCGVNYINTPNEIRSLIYIGTIFVLIILILYIIIKLKKEINERRKTVYVDILFIAFIFMCIISSSVTFRLEMRWIYVSFAASLLYLSYMVSYIIETFNKDKSYNIIKSTLILFMLIITVFRTNIENFYISHYDKIYIFHYLKITNALADKTIYKYGYDYIKNKEIYLLTNNFLLEKFEINFFEPFTKEPSDEVVIHIADKDNFTHLLVDDKYLLLIEDFDNNDYIEWKDYVEKELNK